MDGSEGLEEVGIDALDVLRAREVARFLKVSERQAWRLIHNGDIKSIRVGAQGVRVTRPALAAYIRGREEAAGQDTAQPKAS